MPCYLLPRCLKQLLEITILGVSNWQLISFFYNYTSIPSSLADCFDLFNILLSSISAVAWLSISSRFNSTRWSLNFSVFVTNKQSALTCMANAVTEPSYVMVLMKKKQNTNRTISFLSKTTLINILHHHVCQTEMA